MGSKAQLIAGVFLAVLGILGFFTFADDFRHFGEISVAFGLLLAGTCLVFIALRPSFNSTLALQWLSVAILLGLVLGAALNATAACFVFGLAAGLALARVFRTKVTVASNAAT